MRIRLLTFLIALPLLGWVMMLGVDYHEKTLLIDTLNNHCEVFDQNENELIVETLADLEQIEWISFSPKAYRIIYPKNISRLRSLKHAIFRDCPIEDLSPLADLEINFLDLTGSNVVDLSAVRKMPLAILKCSREVEDISPLKGMRLEYLSLAESKVTDISSLKGMKLRRLSLAESKVTDISCLSDMTTLRSLDLSRTKIRDLSPLKNLNLTSLKLDGTNVNVGTIPESVRLLMRK